MANTADVKSIKQKWADTGNPNMVKCKTWAEAPDRATHYLLRR